MADTRLRQPEDVAGILYQRGLSTSKNNTQQLAILWSALIIFMDREKVRGSLWAKFDAEDAANNMRTKFLRIDHMVRHPSDDVDMGKAEIIDDALDLINYTAFLVRHLLDWKPEVKESSGTEEYRKYAR